MKAFVESLKRLYSSGKIDIIKVKDLLKENKITSEQYEYIVSEKDNE